MPGKIVINKFKPEWGQGYTDNNSKMIDGKIPVNFQDPQDKTNFKRVLVMPIKLDFIGFWE